MVTKSYVVNSGSVPLTPPYDLTSLKNCLDADDHIFDGSIVASLMIEEEIPLLIRSLNVGALEHPSTNPVLLS